MNCTKCNIPGARYQFISGLCHTCTAIELQQLRNTIGQNICIQHNDAERLEASKRCPVCDMQTVKQLYNRIKVLR